MDEKEIQALIDKALAPLKHENEQLHARCEEFRTKNDELRKKFEKADEENIDLQARVKRQEKIEAERAEEAKREAVKLARSKVMELVELAVKQKKLLPAQRESTIALFGINDDDRVVKLDPETLKTYFQLSDKVEDDKGKGNKSGAAKFERIATEEGDEDRVEKDIFKEVDRRARLEMARNPGKLDYRAATRAVFASDPELHREYLNATPPLRANAGGE